MKKVFLYSLFVMLFISACGGPAAPPPIAVNLSTGAAQAMDQGQSVVITATVASDSSNKGVTWALTGVGAISGQTTTSVTYTSNGATGTATVTATSIADTTKSFAVVVTVTAAPAITTTTLAAGVEGTAYSQAVAKTGGAGTVTFSISAGALPAGLTLSSAGTISGTPIGPNGTANFTVKVTDSSAVTPLTATQVLAITISLPPAPAITTTALPAGVEGTAYSQAVAATGFGALTFTTSAGTLPPGLALSSAGLISGTPLGPNATSNFTIKVTDSSNPTQSATQALSIAVALPPAPSITTATLAPGVEGTAYSQSVVATGGLGALTFTVSAGTLPPGLSLSSAGLISGTPLGPNATSNFTVKVTDSSNPTQSVTKPLSILVNLPPAPSISPTTLPGGNVGTPYNQTLTVSAGLGPFTWVVSSGTLPGGLSLTGSNTTATISGTPTTTQTNVAFTIRVTDTSNPPQSAPQAYTVTISAPLPLSITTTSPLPQAAANIAYSTTISATGGIAPYTFSLDGTSGPLPAGLNFSSGSNQGLISGTPTAPGTFTNIIVDVRDSQGVPATAQKTFTLTVAAPPSIATLSQTSGTVGTSITITGTNFGTTQGSSTVKFNGVSAGTATSWSSTSIAVTVPAGATTGNVVVTVSGAASNGSPFTVTPSCTTNCALSGTVTGPWVAGVTITLSGTAGASTTTAANGTYSFANLAAGTYTITPTLAGYTYTPAPPTIAINSNTVQNFVATSALTSSFSISGTLSGNSTPGIVYIRVFNCPNCSNSNTTAGTTLASVSANSGSYTVRGLSPGNYTVRAQIDTLNNGAPNESNPAGSISGVSITSADVTGQNIIIGNRSPVVPVTPNKPSVFPSSGTAFISYKQPRDNNGEEIATSYKIYRGTDTAASNLGSITIQPGDSTNVYILSGLTDGTQYYFKMTSLNANGESPASPVVGPVTIGATSGSNTVSGSVTFSGIPLPLPAGAALYVGMYSNTSGVYFQRISNPVSPQAYSVAGIPVGTYQEFAVLDVNGAGIVGVGDVTNFGPNGPPSLAVNTSISGNNITLVAASAKTFVATNHQRSGSGDSYNINLSSDVGTKRPVSMTLFSGNNVAVPFDMIAERNTSFNPIFNNSVRPLSTDTYQFLVTFSDGTTQIMTNTGLTVLDSFAQTLMMNTPVNSTSLTPLTVPMLNWSAPASPPAFYNYSSVSLDNANGAQEHWEYNGGNNSNGIPSTQLNVMFNVNGSANPSSSLTTGTTYNWRVTVRDDNGNTAQFTTTYIP